MSRHELPFDITGDTPNDPWNLNIQEPIISLGAHAIYSHRLVRRALAKNFLTGIRNLVSPTRVVGDDSENLNEGERVITNYKEGEPISKKIGYKREGKNLITVQRIHSHIPGLPKDKGIPYSEVTRKIR